MDPQLQMNEEDAEMAEGQDYRAGAYSLLAALLRATPDQAMLQHLATLASLENDSTELETAMCNLGKAAQTAKPAVINDEFHGLFVGLGRGELLPYASWYQTGFLMEKPLGKLREDLEQLGYARCQETKEPEDHIAALCEVMYSLISDGCEQATTSNCIEQQRLFFETHIKPWVLRFFSDLKKATSAAFYQQVADFGKAFFEFETTYFSMEV